MSKVAQYLNEHIIGEVTSSSRVREAHAIDGSILRSVPELVMFPRVTTDIRKAARFSWQLAEKGHRLSVTARGGGNDATGGAIGSGLVMSLSRHMNSILYVGHEKERFVHVQPGVTLKTLSDALAWKGFAIDGADASPTGTVGGAIARNLRTDYGGRSGRIGDSVERLEVVLANGDMIETKRISRKELNRKKGLQTLEGEIYRQIDAIIEDNSHVIEGLSRENLTDNVGYRIERVKQKDGSFDLTPLFIGSQGTLGIISEAVVRTSYFNQRPEVLVVLTASTHEARDLADALSKLQPSTLDIIDGRVYEDAFREGKRYLFTTEDGPSNVGGVVYVSFDDAKDKQRDKKLKKALKICNNLRLAVYSSQAYAFEELDAIRDVWTTVGVLSESKESYVSLLDQAIIPTDRNEEFESALQELAAKHHIILPLHMRLRDGSVETRPLLDLTKVSDKQRVFKLVADYAALITQFGGVAYGNQAEGRIGAFAAYPQYGEQELEVYKKIREIFDPYGTLNPGVKQPQDIKTLVSMLNA